MGFIVSRFKCPTRAFSSGEIVTPRAGLPSSNAARTRLKAPFSSSTSFASAFALFFVKRSRRRSICSMSETANSRLITSVSDSGSTRPSTWMTFSSSKHRTTYHGERDRVWGWVWVWVSEIGCGCGCG